MPDLSPYLHITDPTLIFLVVLLIILFAPIIMGKLRIPHIVGLILAGIVVGKFGLNILENDDSFKIFGKVGLNYIMFLAALEMDLEGLKRNKEKTLIYGLLTSIIPGVLTFAVSAELLGYGFKTSFLLSCIMSSNTLVAYPIIGKYGLQRKRSVVLSVGSTMVSLILSLVAVAALSATDGGEGGWLFWSGFLLKFALFCATMTWAVPRLTRWFLRRYSDAVMQFIFVLSVLFSGAWLSGIAGLEGIFGAFVAGLILNRYVPHTSPLMNRIEFIGNAIFIPYFLIGMGMLINIRLLFDGGTTLWITLCIVFFGTLGKAIAAYGSARLFKMRRPAGNMMFGLTSAHAAGAIALVMIGMRMTDANGQALVNDAILNGIVLTILFSCIISTLVTEHAAQQTTLKERELPSETAFVPNSGKMLIPIKYPEYAVKLIDLALLMRTPKTENDIVALNVVYDDENMRTNQQAGRDLLEKAVKYAAGANVKMTTQVRIAANIANGIKHAFKENQASEVLIGLHAHKETSNKFWGQFHQSLFNGLNSQIIMVRINQPPSTLRRIQVAVPSRAQYEPGFYQWVERVSRLAENLECRVQFHGRPDTLAMLSEYISNRHPAARAEYSTMEHWDEMPRLATSIHDDHLFIVVTARQGTVSYKSALERLPEELKKHFNGKNLMIIFPDQFGESMDEMTFFRPQHTEERSAYDLLGNWLHKELRR